MTCAHAFTIALAASTVTIAALAGAPAAAPPPVEPMGQAAAPLDTPVPSDLEAAILAAAQADASPAYDAAREGEAIAFRNEAQRLDAHVDGASLRVRAGDGQAFTWRVVAAGPASGERPLDAGAPRAAGNRVEIDRADGRGLALTEWYVNGPLGVQQGFTVRAWPGASAPDRLSIATRIDGARLAEVGEASASVETAGGTRLAIAGLHAWDATGRMLPVRFRRADAGTLAIDVETAGARLPIVVDPVMSVGSIHAAEPQEHAGFGGAVAVDGTLAVVGSPGQDVVVLGSSTPRPNVGAVYVFEREPAGWTLQATLSPPTEYATSNRGFGMAVALSGDRLAVGSRADDRLFVYERAVTGWSLVWSPEPPSPATQFLSLYGSRSLALDGDFLAASTCVESYIGCADSVATALRTPGGWQWTSVLRESEPGTDFGIAVDLAGGRLAVGAPGETPPNQSIEGGVVHLYDWSGFGWFNEQLWSAPTPSSSGLFGANLRFDRSGTGALIAGEPGWGTSTGRAHILEPMRAASYTLEYAGRPAWAGWRLALSGNRAIVAGAEFQDAAGLDAATFVRTAAGWTLAERWTAGSGEIVWAASGLALAGDPEYANNTGRVFVPALNNTAAMAQPLVAPAVGEPAVRTFADTFDATADAMPLPPGSCAVHPQAKGVWYTFTGNGRVLYLDTSGSSYDTHLAIFQGQTDAALSFVACDNNSGQANGAAWYLATTSGIRYWVLVTSMTGDGGYLQFTLGPQSRDLAITLSGAGSGTVTSTPAGLDCGLTCLAPFPDGSTVMLTATPAAGAVFTGWSGDCVVSGGACFVVMNGPRNVGARFEPATLPLTITKAGTGSGLVASEPAGIACGLACSAPFAFNQNVTLTATPGADSVFEGWSGEGCSGTGACTVAMSAARAVIATFRRDVPANAAPTIAITAPATVPGDTHTEASIAVRGTASDDAAVTAVTWRNTTTGASGAATGLASWRADIPLTAGANTLEVTARDAQGLTATATRIVTLSELRYALAEGATGTFFDFDVAIANPNAVAVDAVVEFLRENGTPVTVPLPLPPQSRRTIAVDEIPGLEGTSVSAVVRSPAALPLVVERTMSWGEGGYGAHGAAAIGGARERWLFAEGSQGFFDTYLLLANASPAPVTATLRFLRERGAPVVRSYPIGAHARITVDAGAIPELVDQSFGVVVEATGPIYAERAMYFSRPGGPLWEGGHASPGVNEPSTTWFLAEGATGPFFDCYLLIGNPNDTPATIGIRYLLSTGEVIERQRTLGAQARLTVSVEHEDDRLADAAVSTVVTADVPVVVERAMYWPNLPWGEAHNSFGVTTTALRWGLAEGRAGGPRGASTYILLANPASTPADVRVTYLRETGAPIVRDYRVPPTSRFSIDVGARVPELADGRFGAVIEVTAGPPIVVERALYWSANGEVWAAGTGATAVPLP